MNTTSIHSGSCARAGLLLLGLGALVMAAPAVPALVSTGLVRAGAVPGPLTRDQAATRLLTAAGVDGTAKGRALFEEVLASELFMHVAEGPFDLYGARFDGQERASVLKKSMGMAQDALAQLCPVLEQRFSGTDGVLSGKRFPIILVDSNRDDGEQGFDEVMGLLDRCEDEGYSGWKPWIRVWDPANLSAETFHTWEVLVVNLGHPTINEQGLRGWFKHPFGFTVLQTLSRRALAQGAWGTPVPWLAQGLADELDIEAHGRAWVSSAETGVSSSWSSSRSSRFTSVGWSGFLRDGQQPPPPKVTRTSTSSRTSSSSRGFSEKWGDRTQSKSRHWRDLAADQKSKEPAGFREMAEERTFEPRDRALSRLAVYLLVDVLPTGQTLLEGLDRKPHVPKTLMRDSEPLPVLVARALGGVPAVDAFEAQPMRAVLTAAEREDLIASIESHGGGGMLELTDHRKQAEWLYMLPRIDTASRRLLELAIQEAEFEQQRLEWVLVGEALDVAVQAALAASKRFPDSDKQREKVAAAMTDALDAFRAEAAEG